MDWIKRFFGAFDPTQGWSKHHKILTYVILIVLLVLLVFSWTIFRPERVIEKVTERVIELPAATLPAPPPTTIIKEVKEVEVIPLDVRNKLKSLEDENTALRLRIAGYEKDQVSVIIQTNIIGTITARQALDLIKASCPKTSSAGGLRAVEFSEADLISESIFKAWLAEDKTEDEALGDSWDYIAALEYKLRLQSGGKNIPFNRARRGDQTFAAVLLYDEVAKAARLYIFHPLDEENLKKIDPATPDQVIEYVHLD